MNRNLWLVMSGIFCVFATQTMAFVLIPLMAVATETPGSGIGALVAVLAGMGLVTDVVVGATSDRLGRRAPLLLGSLVGGLAGVVLSITSDFPGLLAGAALFGLALSLIAGPALAYLTEACNPRDAARVQGYNGAVLGLSSLAGALAVGISVDRVGARSSAWLIAAAMSLALLPFANLNETVTRSTLGSSRELLGSYAAAIRLLRARPRLQLSALVALIRNSVVLVSGNSFLPLYIVHERGESATFAATLLTVRNVAMTLSSPFFGIAVRRLGLVPTMLAANLVAVVGVIGLLTLRDPRLLAIPLVLQGFGVGFAAPTANTLVASATKPTERALGFATNSLISGAGGLLSPLLFGLILQASGAQAVFGAAGAIGLAYIGAMLWTARLVSAGERPGKT